MARPAMFHHFTDAVHPRGQGALDADEFAQILEHVGIGNILEAETWLERFREDTLEETHTCITIDDNLRCQYDVAAPVLDAYGLTALWFVYSSPLDGIMERIELYRYFRTVAFGTVEEFYEQFFAVARDSVWGGQVAAELDRFAPATWHPELAFYTDNDRRFRHLRDGLLANGPYDEIMIQMIAAASKMPNLDGIRDLLWMDGDCWRDLVADGHVLGLHSHTHPTSMATLSAENQWSEYLTNAARIETEVGAAPSTVAHPSGSYSMKTLELLRDLGVSVGFAVAAGIRWDPSMEVQRTDSAELAAEAGLR